MEMRGWQPMFREFALLVSTMPGFVRQYTILLPLREKGHFTRSISAIAPAGARTLPSWMMKANTSRGVFGAA
jgi:hypothetical protein